ncbi:MAG: ankyrin repeat domain-containing protein, partial [Cyanobacteria bacterium J06649_4]
MLIKEYGAVAHSFLLEPGRWKLQGNWLTRDTLPTPVKGKILVVWKQEDCFMVATKLSFPNEDHPEIVRLLIGRGARINFMNDNGWTALIEAADEGSYASAIVLLEAGADIDLH